MEKNRREMQQPEAFEVYSPKALASIQGLEDVLEDRCKVTILKKSRNRRIIDREAEASDTRREEIRSQLYIFYLMFWKEIKALYDKIRW